MNESIAWLYHQYLGDIPKGAEACYLCGTSCQEQYTVMKGLAETFNSHYLAQCPSSLVLCPACYWYFDGKAGHPAFRKMSLVVAHDKWRNWEREAMKADILQWLTHGLEEDTYLVISLNKKKHVLLQAPRNVQNSRGLSLQIEEQVAHIDLRTWLFMDTHLTALLTLGHGKGEILSGNLHTSVLRKHGCIGRALALSDELHPWRSSAPLELLSYVTLVDTVASKEDEVSIHAYNNKSDSTIR